MKFSNPILFTVKYERKFLLENVQIIRPSPPRAAAIIGACRNSCLLIMHKISRRRRLPLLLTTRHYRQVAHHLSRPRRLIFRRYSYMHKGGEHCLTFSYPTRVANSCSPREYLVSLTYINSGTGVRARITYTGWSRVSILFSFLRGIYSKNIFGRINFSISMLNRSNLRSIDPLSILFRWINR